MHDHRRLDAYIDQWLKTYRSTGRNVFCRTGCANCCTMAVHASFPEAILIAKHLPSAIVSRLAAYLSRLKQNLPEMANVKDYLAIHRNRIRPCPFLSTQDRCEIYQNRPFSCRALLSTRPPAWCAVDFATMDKWDRQAFESSLDPQIVAWPTHYIAATQDFGRTLELRAVQAMKKTRGWALSGNLGVMVWLEYKYRLSARKMIKPSLLKELMQAEGIDSPFLLSLEGNGQ